MRFEVSGFREHYANELGHQLRMLHHSGAYTDRFHCSSPPDRLAGLVIKASASGADDPGFESRLRRDFSGSSHTNDFKIGTPVAIPCQASGIIGSALGLVGPVSVYCDWVR